jgi:hypothetical protein
MVRYNEIVEAGDTSVFDDKKLKQYFRISGHIRKKPDGYYIDGDCVRDFHTMHELMNIPVKIAYVRTNFSVEGCSNLSNLENGPEEVGDFTCDSSSIESFKYGPKIVNKTMYCCQCPFLSSLDGFPEYIADDAIMCFNPLLPLGWDFPYINNIGRRLYISYHKDLPLLRLLSPDYKNSKIYVQWGGLANEEEEQVKGILSKYDNNPTWKKSVVDCQYELIKAGFKGNAKW